MIKIKPFKQFRMSKIYEPSGRAREYSPLALNLYHGCTHGCVYCYVPKMFCRWGEYKHSDCYPTVDFDELERSAAKLQGCNKQILLSFTGDPYCGVEPDTTTKALEILLKYGHKVAILTKGGLLCQRDLPLFMKFGNRIKVGATLTFDNDEDTERWEPGAASVESRIEALESLHCCGIKTWVSFEPVVYPEQALNLIDMIYPFVDHVKIGKINNYKGVDKGVDWHKFVVDSVALCRSVGLKFYIKESLRPYAGDVHLQPEETDQDYLNV